MPSELTEPKHTALPVPIDQKHESELKRVVDAVANGSPSRLREAEEALGRITAKALTFAREVLNLSQWIETAGMTVGYGTLGFGIGMAIAALPGIIVPWWHLSTAGALFSVGAYRVLAVRLRHQQ